MTTLASLNDFVASVKKLSLVIDDKLLEDHEGIKVLRSSSSAFITHCDDSEMSDTVNDLEISTGYYLFDENAMVDKTAIKLLQKNGMDLVKIGKQYMVKTDKFHMFVTI